jgi:hypothetical protein
MNAYGRLNSFCAVFALLAICAGISMGIIADFGKRELPNGLHSPVLAMQLIEADSEMVRIILGPAGDPGDDRGEMIEQIMIDWVFICFYTGLFISSAILLYRKGSRIFGVLVASLGMLAAIFDVTENLTILNLVDPDNPAIPHAIIAAIEPAPRFWALKKWTAVFLLLLPAMRIYFNPGIPSVRRWMGWIAAAFALLAAILGLCGIFFGTDPLIEKGVGLMTLSLLTGFVFFATHSWLDAGLLPALDRLANRKYLRRLARWPNDEDD